MIDLVFSAQETLKILPGVVMLGFTVYFAWKKIGQKVSVSYSTFHKKTVAPRIGEVNITNWKDRPLTIFSMYAVIDDDVAILVEEFSPPLVLKALETTRIETRPYSSTHVGTEEYLPKFDEATVDIYIVTNHGLTKCKIETSPSIRSLREFKPYKIASRRTLQFNGRVYNDRAKYAITYIFDSEQLTAIVDSSGFIGEDWDFKYSLIPETYMESAEKVVEYLNVCGFNKIFKTFAVDKLPA